jgi:hypothetical protein
MKAAGDVCRCNKREDFVIVTRAFAEIGVKIDSQLHEK